jgi:hypothetical protein
MAELNSQLSPNGVITGEPGKNGFSEVTYWQEVPARQTAPGRSFVKDENVVTYRGIVRAVSHHFASRDGLPVSQRPPFAAQAHHVACV